MGADVICIKDMANLLLLKDVYSLCYQAQGGVDLPIHLHTIRQVQLHVIYHAAALAGVDIIDRALSHRWRQVSSQPATESLVAAFKGTPVIQASICLRSTRQPISRELGTEDAGSGANSTPRYCVST